MSRIKTRMTLRQRWKHMDGRRQGESTLERRMWVVAFTAAVILGGSDTVHQHVARPSILSTICMVLVIGTVIVEAVALLLG